MREYAVPEISMAIYYIHKNLLGVALQRRVQSQFIFRIPIHKCLALLVLNMTSQLCPSCKAMGLTYAMLRDGFQYPLSLADAIVSGRHCKLCRLMVCMHSKLQLPSPWNPYDVNKDYDVVSQRLLSLPVIHRESVGLLHLPCFDILEEQGRPLSWERSEYGKVLEHGNFNGGATVQVSACEGEVPLKAFVLPL